MYPLISPPLSPFSLLPPLPSSLHTPPSSTPRPLTLSSTHPPGPGPPKRSQPSSPRPPPRQILHPPDRASRTSSIPTPISLSILLPPLSLSAAHQFPSPLTPARKLLSLPRPQGSFSRISNPTPLRTPSPPPDPVSLLSAPAWALSQKLTSPRLRPPRPNRLHSTPRAPLSMGPNHLSLIFRRRRHGPPI
ncbi:hypothetical protein FKM82_001748 [Ascaphus truei]